MSILLDLLEASNETAWVIVYTSERLILGKRSPSTKNPNQWNFFGGHVDAGETSAEAAAREFEEETKCKIKASDLKEIAKINSATYFTIKIDDPSRVKTTTEISSVKQFKLVDLPDNLHSKTQNFFDRLDALFSK